VFEGAFKSVPHEQLALLWVARICCAKFCRCSCKYYICCGCRICLLLRRRPAACALPLGPDDIHDIFTVVFALMFVGRICLQRRQPMRKASSLHNALIFPLFA
jgi:hypothetical protein